MDEKRQRCIDCIHHDACKQWADHLRNVMDLFNATNRILLGDKAKSVSNIEFPMVQSSKYAIMCVNFSPR